MPIDLDSLIYVLPCGKPGDVDALSGRAHICNDRMRIAVTDCLPSVPGFCGCWRDTHPGEIGTRFVFRLEGAVFCDMCTNWETGMGIHRSTRYTWEWGTLNDTDYPMFGYGGTLSCHWYTGDSWPNTAFGGWRKRVWDDWGCEGYLMEDSLHDLYGSLTLSWAPPWEQVRFQAGAYLVSGYVDVPGPWDCRRRVVIPNMSTRECGELGGGPVFGPGGNIIITQTSG